MGTVASILASGAATADTGTSSSTTKRDLTAEERQAQERAAHDAAAKSAPVKITDTSLSRSYVRNIPGLKTTSEAVKVFNNARGYNVRVAEDKERQAAVNAMYTGKGRKSRKLGRKFSRCVKSVRKTIKARKGSSKESAAIAICTKSVLQTRGRTMKRYRKGRLTTQKKR